MTLDHQVAAGGSRNRFIGRAREVAELRAALDDTIAGHGRLILISGEPGIGKTRLSEEISTEAASHGMCVLWGRGWEGEGAPPYWPIIQIVRALITRTDLTPVLAAFPIESLAHIASIVPEIRQRGSLIIPDARTTPPLDGARSRFELFDAIVKLLRAYAVQVPLVLLVDDLHDTDLSSLQLLAFIARGLKDSRVLVLGTHRDAEVRRSADLSKHIGELHREGTTMPLGGLSQSEVAEFVETRVGSAANVDLVSSLYLATDGNPLFVDGVVRLMLTDNEFELRRGREGTFKIPQGVRESIRRQLSTLSAETRGLLKIASVIGNDFEADLLAAVSAKKPERLRELIEHSIVAGLVFRSASGSGRFRFSHALIRGVVYDEIDANERPLLHLATASFIEELYGSDLNPYLAALAHHFREAGRYREAIEYASRAGDAAKAVYAYEEALSLWDGVIPLIERHGEDRKHQADLLWKSGRLLSPGDPTQAVTRLEEAAKIYEQTNDFGAAAQVHNLLGAIFASPGQCKDLTRALTHLQKAEPFLKSGPKSQELTILYFQMSTVARWELRVRESLKLMRRAVAVAEEQGAVEVWCAAASHLGWFLNHAGALREAEAIEARVWETMSEIGDAWRDHYNPWGAMLGGFFQISALWDFGNALKWAQRGLSSPWLMEPHRRDLLPGAANLLASLGDLETARHHLKEAGLAPPYLPLIEGLWELKRQRVEEYLGVANKDVDAARLDFPEGRVGSTHELARVLRVLGAHDRACVIIEEWLEKFPPDEPHLQVEMLLRPELALHYVALGKLDSAREQVGRCAQIVSIGENWRGLAGFQAHASAALATAEGRYAIAEEHFRIALGVFRKFSLVTQEADTFYDWGRARNSAGDGRGANQKFDAAVEIYRRVGFGQRWIDRVEEARRKPSPRATSPAKNACTFQREGDFWTISHRDRTFRIKDMKGLHYIAHLLAHPGQQFHVHDLIGVVDGSMELPDANSSSGLRVANDLGDAGAILDARAKAEYRKRGIELRAELAEAESANDIGALERIREELEMVEDQLTSALGLGGRDRKAADHSERSRSRVARAIRGSLSSIRENDASLGHHLSTCIRTGYLCAYHPDPEGRFVWRL